MTASFLSTRAKKRRTRVACPSLFGDATHESDQALYANGAQNPVRFRRSEIDKLACQAESVRIFALARNSEKVAQNLLQSAPKV